MVIDHGKVVYAEKESGGGEVTVSPQKMNRLITTDAKLVCLGIGRGGSTVQALEAQYGPL